MADPRPNNQLDVSQEDPEFNFDGTQSMARISQLSKDEHKPANPGAGDIEM